MLRHSQFLEGLSCHNINYRLFTHYENNQLCRMRSLRDICTVFIMCMYLMFRVSVIKHVLAWPQLREILVNALWHRKPFDKADVRLR